MPENTNSGGIGNIDLNAIVDTNDGNPTPPSTQQPNPGDKPGDKGASQKTGDNTDPQSGTGQKQTQQGGVNPNDPPQPDPDPDNTDPGNVGNDGQEGDSPGDDEVEIFENDNGDYVDKDGNVVVAKDDAEFDDEGNLILPDGYGETPITEHLVNKLNVDFGLELTDADGNPKTYADNDEGIANLVIDGIKTGVLQEREAMFSTYPEVKTFLQHLQAGRDPASYFNVSSTWRNYSLPDTKKDDDASNNMRRHVVLENLKVRFGYYDAPAEKRENIFERAKNIATLTEDSGNLAKEADTALEDLKAWESNQEKARDAKNAALIEEQKEKDRRYWNNVEKTIEGGDLKGLKIPKNERQAFFDYVGKDVTGKGVTQEMIDQEEEDLSLSLQLSYLRFKKFNLREIAKNVAADEKVRSLRSRKRSTKVVGRRGSDTKDYKSGQSQKKGNFPDINQFVGFS